MNFILLQYVNHSILHILGHYFDMHQRPILSLIHKIQLSTVGKKMARNEIHVKYHYHSCPVRFEPNFFLKIYDFLYARKFGFNRYTIILGREFFNIKCASSFIFFYFSFIINQLWEV